MRRIFSTSVLSLVYVSAPLVAAANAVGNAEAAAAGFIAAIEENLIFPLVTLLLGFAFLIFLYGVFEYIKGAASEAERSKGRRHMFWGILGMLVMLSAQAILALTLSSFL